MNQLIQKAVKKAQSNYSNRYKISALGLNSKGELLGSATNSPRFSRYGGGVHAEMALLKRYGSNVKTIIICRVGASGDVLPIQACDKCQKVLDKLKIKVISVTA